jgi:nucleotide-binding universal stress UspA family protein
MRTPRGILVGYDGSTDADIAVEWAARAAEQTQEPLRIAVVEDVNLTDGPGEWTASYWMGVELQATSTLTALGLHEPDVQRFRGRPVPVLLERAADASLLVVGSRGHGRVGEMFLGSVSQHLAGHAPCPVAVARVADRPNQARIVVGMDGSGAAVRALEFACRRAAKTGEKVVAVRGWRVGDVRVDQRGNIPASMSAHLMEREQELTAWTETARTAHPDVAMQEEVLTVSSGRALVDASADASLVVVGSRGRNAFTGMLLGSTSHEVLHRAHCSVVVVR